MKLSKWIAAGFLGVIQSISPAFAQSPPLYVLGSRNVINISDYGAVCDGTLIPSGVATTNGSPTISTPGYTFTNADVGKAISLTYTTPLNSFATPTHTFSGTIVSASAGNANVSSNLGWTSNSIGAAARFYFTDNKNAIQAALNAGSLAGKNSQIAFPSQTCVTSGPLTFYSGERIIGQDFGTSIIMLANGSNSDLFVGANFASLTGTQSISGVKDFSFENIQLDGNRGSNTGSGAGTAAGVGSGIRVYGYEFTTNNLFVNNFASDGVYTEWSNVAGCPVDTTSNQMAAGCMDAWVQNVTLDYNAGYAWTWSGPHDSKMSYVRMTGNGFGGVLVININQGDPLNIDHAHGYVNGNGSGSTGFDFIFSTSGVNCYDCQAEGGVHLTGGTNYNFTNDIFSGAGLVIGKSGGGQVYHINATNVITNIIDNSAIGAVNSQFQDQWFGGSVGTIAGGTYQPYYAYGVVGMKSQVGGQGDCLQWVDNASFPSIACVTSGSVFQLTNGGVVAMQIDSHGNNSFTGALGLGAGGQALTKNPGELGLSTVAVSASAPGAGGGKLALVCGTTSGTAKLVAYAGTSATPVTVIDNIGAAVTGC